MGKYEIPARRAGEPASAALVARRAAIATAPNLYTFDDRVVLSEQRIGSVRCLSLTPPDAKGNLVHFHGGGFRLNAPDRLAPFASHLAVRAGCRIVLPAYGLAPEHPFPAGLRDGDAVLRALADGGEIILSGDSAGGNIAAVLALIHAESRGASIRGLLLFSPWLDLTVSASSYTTKAETDPLFSRESALEAAGLYLQGHPATDALASPLFADLGSMPPSLIIVSGAEVLLDDSLAFASKLAAANVDVALHAIPNMQHVAATLAPDLEGARRGFDLAAAFLARQFRGGS